MTLSFAPSARASIGLEWELALVNRADGELTSVADRVLEELRDPSGAPHPHITGELLLNTVELVSGVHGSVPAALSDLRGQLAEVRAVTDPLGVDLVSAGTHPFGQWFDQPVTETERYRRLIERTRWWGRNMLIWGAHVHVGVEDRAKVLPILGGLLAYLPHLQALSASSPYWGGVDTGYASNRALMFQQLPTAGLPYEMADWAAFEAYVEDLTRTGIVEDVTEVRWDIRPAPRWGTIEVRVCDAPSSPAEFAAIAALIHCLTERLSGDLDRGIAPTVLPAWYLRENKWRAARYGLEAHVIVSPEGAQRPVAEHLLELIAELAPEAERLGCAAELDSLRGVIASGGSASRQRAVAAATGGDLRAVVRSLARELR